MAIKLQSLVQEHSLAAFLTPYVIFDFLAVLSCDAFMLKYCAKERFEYLNSNKDVLNPLPPKKNKDQLPEKTKYGFEKTDLKKF